MERDGRIIVIWPEDELLSGDRLQVLTELLAPRADAISEAPKGDIEGVEQCEAAIIDTLHFLGQTVLKANLQEIIHDCWHRTDEQRLGNTNRAQALTMAMFRLIERNEIVLGDDYKVGVAPVASSQAA
jgi:hypothetical protein